MKLSRNIALGLSVGALLLFNGCTEKYYATSPVKHEIAAVSKKVPVKLKVTHSGRSILIRQSDETVKKHVTDAVFNNPVFNENNDATQVLKVDIKHSNDHGGAEMAGAILTGTSMYLIPSVVDSDVDITISTNGIQNTYKGELVVAQGLASSALIDKNKYTEYAPFNLMKKLIKNALDEFTIAYVKNRLKDSTVSIATESAK